jgi:FMN phosphatase YigB (HAD superfamily)
MINSPNGIRAILFDLDGTLRHRIPSGSDEFNRYAASLGVPIGPEDATRAAHWEHFYFANSPEIKADNALFKEDDNNFWVIFGRRRLVALGCNPALAGGLAEKIAAWLRDNHKPQTSIPEEALTILPELKRVGYILGVVSNRENRFDQQLQEMGFGDIFHFTLAGGEIRAFKPERAIFEESLRRAGTSAPETMYVGDNYFADVVGSRRAGLQPVLYDPSGLFPEAECPVIKSFDQLPKLLK